jgi:hypothetical protein
MDAGKQPLFAKVRLWAEKGTPGEVLLLWKKHGGKVVEKPEQAMVLISDNEQAPTTLEILTKRYTKFPNGAHKPVWSSDIVQYWIEEGALVTNPAVTKVYLRKPPPELSFDLLELSDAENSLDGFFQTEDAQSKGSSSDEDHSGSPAPELGSEKSRGAVPRIRSRGGRGADGHERQIETAPRAGRRSRRLASGPLWMSPKPEHRTDASTAPRKPPKHMTRPLSMPELKHVHRRNVLCRVCNPNGVKIRKPRSPDAHYHRRGVACPACVVQRQSRSARDKSKNGSKFLPKQGAPMEAVSMHSNSKPGTNKVEVASRNLTNAPIATKNGRENPKRMAYTSGSKPRKADSDSGGALSAIETLQELRSRYAKYIEFGAGISRIVIGRDGFALRIQDA